MGLTSAWFAMNRRDRWLAQAIWAFVALGVLLRIARYVMNCPLWWDEAFVAVNFLRRDYGDLLKPLDYGQVCPILFLWCELFIVKLLGFSEWSLRLFPLASAIASVFLFRHVTGRIVRGLPWLLAVAIFAVSFHPIVHAADVKPYASDLLAALVLLAIAVEWLRAPDQSQWMWIMAVVAPLALALSHPAIFIATGNMLAFAPVVMKVRRRAIWIGYTAFALSTTTAFTVLYLACTRAQATAYLSAMQTQWAAAFPPLHDLFGLITWFVKVHTGSMFAYPCGGENGASSLTLLLFLLGVAAFWHRDRKQIVWACLAPFGMAIIAAAMRRYPYGGPVPHGSPARVMQYLGPSICLFAGIGAAALLSRWHDSRRRRRVILAILICLAALGVIPVAADGFHPYRAVHAQRAREFARQFWPEISRAAYPVCLRWDVGLGDWDSTNLNVAVYLCNQMIYSPHRQHRQESGSQFAPARKVLRCISSLTDSADNQAIAWLDSMKKHYQLNDYRTVSVNMAEPGARARMEYYYVYEFTPAELARPVELQAVSRGLNGSFLAP